MYLDDIAVISKSPPDHSKKVRHVLRLLYKAGVTLRLHKCKLFVEIIDYLGYVVRLDRPELA